MGRLAYVILCLAAVAAVSVTGCIPNRAAVSPDGKTFYFSLNDEGGFDTNDSSRICALDIETGRLTALTEPARPAAWCALSSDGRLLTYMTGTEDADQALYMMRTDTGIFWPLTGILQKHSQPWMVPGLTPRLVAMSRPGADKPGRWVAYTPNEVPLPLPADAAAGLGNVAMAQNRCAVTVYLPGPPPAKEGEESRGATAVYIITFPQSAEEIEMAAGKDPVPTPAAAGGNVTTAVRVAEWKDLKDDQSIVDLAYSADGKRLVAAMLGCGEKEDDTRFVELDPAGKQPPKQLFDMYKAYYPQFTPDGKGLVLLRTTHENEKVREVVLWRPDAKETILARLPGELGKAYTCWHWLLDGRLRIYHISDEGVRLIETTADGKTAKARVMTHDRLKASRHLADLQYAIERPGMMPLRVGEEWDKAYDAQLKAAEAPIDAAAKAVKAGVEEAWKSVIRWDEVPVMMPNPPVTPDVVVPQPTAPATPTAAPVVTPTAASATTPTADPAPKMIPLPSTAPKRPPAYN
jgi:hypothetical protein